LLNANSSAGVRLNLLAVVNFLKSFTLGGAPVDWISVVPLRDIVPWAGQIIFDLLDKINALLDAFQGVIDEINNFIALLERKINALEDFIRSLIDILNFIESLEFAAHFLNVSGIQGDAAEWLNAIETAGGDPPPNDPTHYSAGIALAYVAPNVEAFTKAFQIIFG
jgi:hypothetical protein